MLRSALAAATAAALLTCAGASHAAIHHFKAELLGSNESPPNASPGVGLANVFIDDVLNTMLVDITFSDLLGASTASHIHCCTAVAGTGTASVATTVPNFTGFPLGVHGGDYSHLFDLTAAGSYNPTFISGHGGTTATAEAALLSGILAGDAYLNIHSSAVGSGEIRGFLATVPEPGTWAAMLVGFALCGLGLRRPRTAGV
jgi:hypothetical protein